VHLEIIQHIKFFTDVFQNELKLVFAIAWTFWNPPLTSKCRYFIHYFAELPLIGITAVRL